jgi:hypothetical protein
MGQGLLVIRHRAEIADIKLTAAGPHISSFSGGSLTCLPMFFPRGVGGVMLAILVMPWFHST